MKPASEIHAEVGINIGGDLHTRGQQRAFGYRAFTVSDIAKIIADAKAESKGVCEWRLNHTMHHVSACGGKYFIEPSRHFQFCPGCGKEVKVV